MAFDTLPKRHAISWVVQHENDRQAMSFPIIEVPLLASKHIVLITKTEKGRPGFDLYPDELTGGIAFAVNHFGVGVDSEVALQLSSEQPLHR